MKYNKHFITFLLSCFLGIILLTDSKAQNINLSNQAQVDAFSSSTVAGDLSISGSDISDLTPLSVLTTVGGYIRIFNNPALTSFENVFTNLTQTGGIDITNNPVLTHFSDFNSLVNNTGGIYMYSNASLETFSGFSSLVSTGDNMDFWYNTALTSFSGFESLQTVGWSLEIGGSDVLTDIPDFNNLVTISSSLFILDNLSLTEITGFNSLEYVDWSFVISGNESLNNFCGFFNFFDFNNGVYPGGGAFIISDNLSNPEIQDILNSGQCNVAPAELIEVLITLVDGSDLPNGTKNSLTSSLENALKSLGKGNTGAAINQLQAFINKVEAQSGKQIDENTANDWIGLAQDIIDAIQASLAKDGNVESLTSSDVKPETYSLNQNYPNPFNPTTSVSYSIPSDGYVTLSIYDALGKEVAVLDNGFRTAGNYSHTFDASNLSSGMYFYTIRSGDFVQTKKMLLMK